MAQNNTSQIKHVIQILSQEFALSQHPHSRKGGLIGLAACSIALGKVGASGVFFGLCRLQWENGGFSWVSMMGRLRLVAPGSLPALQPVAGLCLSLPVAPSHIPRARQRFLVWVASWQLPKRGLSASVHSLSPAAGLNSSGQVLICVNGVERRCGLFHLPPPAQLAPAVQSGPLGSGVKLWAERQQSHSPSKQEV